MSTEKPWLTTTEAGKLLGRGRTTVWQWLVRGVIPETAVRMVGTRHLISRAWVLGQEAACG